MMLVFTVYGVAQPKGSAKAFVPKGWKRPVVTSDNPRNKGWQHLVAAAASQALELGGGEPVFFEGPVRLSVAFYLPRPKKYLTAKTAGEPIAHVTKPDLDKLVRSVKDALTKVIWTDDSQVTELEAAKHYTVNGRPPQVTITVQPSFSGKSKAREALRSTIADPVDPQHPLLLPSTT